MAEKLKPVTRQEILDLAVTDVDAFTALRYLRHRETVPTIPDLESKGRESFPGIEGSLLDLYQTLWAPAPGVREEVSPDRKYWQKLLNQTMTSSVYQELHAKTQLKELLSVMGTISMGESILVHIPEEDKEKLRELNQAQQEANQLEQKAQQAQANAQVAQMLAQAAMQGDGKGQEGQSGQAQSGDGNAEGSQESSDQSAGGESSSQSGQGQSQASNDQSQGQPSGSSGGMTQDAAKEIANQLAKQAQQAQANADALQKQVEDAKSKVEELSEALMGEEGSQEAFEKQRELARIGIAAANQAKDEMQDILDTVQAWGLEAGDLTREGFEEVQHILERVKKNPALKQFYKMLGNLRKIAARKAKSSARGESVTVANLETGDDIKRATRRELVALTHPALQVSARKRWARGELQLKGQKSRQKLGHGPVVVCEDASGSMDGSKQQWAKALILAMATFAKIQKRTFGWVLFDSYVHQAKSFLKGVLSAREMLEIAESRAGGGTDFESPLRKATEMIKQEGLKKADIVLITDGMCAVSDAFLQELLAVKKALEIKIYTVLVNVGETTNKTVQEFSDKVIKISDLTAEEADRKVISLL